MVRFTFVSALLGFGVAHASSDTWTFDLGYLGGSCTWESTLVSEGPWQFELDVDAVDSTVFTGAHLVGQSLTVDVYSPDPFGYFLDPYASWGFTCSYGGCGNATIGGGSVSEAIFFPSTDPGVPSTWPSAAQGPSNFTGGLYILYGDYYTCASVFMMSAAP